MLRMSLLQTLPYPTYSSLIKKNDWTRKVISMLKLSDSFKDDGEKLINYLDKKGYTLQQFQQLLKDCQSVPTVECSSSSVKHSNPTLKIALLVANADYNNWSRLVTPVTDCKVIGDILKSMGFIIILLENVTSDQFKKSISDICSSIPQKSYVLFYFAGHGFELCGTKYMLGIESPSENYLIKNGVSENFILKHGFLNEPELFILLLDMCRKQPDRKLNPNIYLNIPPMEEYKHICNLIIGYATSPYMPSFEKLCCKSETSLSQVQHDTCEINNFSDTQLTYSYNNAQDKEFKTSNCIESDSKEDVCESDGIGNQLTYKLKDPNRLKGVSLYVYHLSKYLNHKEDFVRILEMVHKDFETEQCEEASSQKPQKLDNVTKQFYLHLKSIGHKEAEDKLKFVIDELKKDVNVKINF